MNKFAELNLDENILKALSDLGFDTPTSIQLLAIPKIISGKDLIASAKTGTGKTAAFILPALQLLKNSSSSRGRPRMLVLVPTRELAMQVAKETEKFSKHLPQFKTVCIFGGVPYPIQKRALARPYDILVATPGRLIDHLNQGRLDLSQIKLFVLDEADRMLDMGFVDAVIDVSNELPKERQTLLFSATIDSKILKISKKLQNHPEEIKAEEEECAKNNIEQRLYFADNMGHKIKLLEHLLANPEFRQGIVFISTKRQADELSDRLQEMGHNSSALHGDMNQRQRTRTIEKLKKGAIRYLVATDVAARGIDIALLSLIINFDLPFQPEDYIHRIGRTGRAGAKGIAISFATRQDAPMLAKINKLLEKPLSAQIIEGLEPKQSNNSPRKSFPPKRRPFRPNRRRVFKKS